MRTIYKYPLKVVDRQTLQLPKGAQPLTVQLQDGRLVLWVDLQPENPLEEKVFHIIGTGHPLPEVYLVYLSTVQMGPLVWHIYDELPDEPEDWPEEEENQK